MRAGVLPDWRMKELIKEGVIIGADEKLVNTSSLDLRVGDEKWKLLGSFLPLAEQKVADALKSPDIVDNSSTKQRFYVDHLQQYAMVLMESLDLPNSISARIFNKSGRGRIGVSLRGLTDNTTHFDIISNSYRGAIYAEVCSTSFPLVVKSSETAIPQIRFYEGNPQPLSGSQLELLLRTEPILTDDKGERSYNEQEKSHMIRTGKLTFTADIPSEGLQAYVAKRDRRTLDLSKKSFYSPDDYFTRIESSKSKSIIVIHPGDFVLVKSKQNIRLPPTVAAEIDEYSPEFGDMKSHYAGLINASHGYDPSGLNTPSRIVFEIRARDQPLIIQDGQKLARFNLYDMWDKPQGSYMESRSTDFGDLRSILPNIFKKD